jgi:hypothetical protein
MADLPSEEQRAFWIERTHDDKAHLRIKCDLSHEGACRFSLWQKAASGIMWQWDGNVEQPTITPSVACNGGCGRHWVITKGVVHG